MNTNSIPYLDQALKYNDALLGLPALPLLALACLCMGYAGKAMPFLQNRFIPLAVILIGIFGNVILGLGGTSDKGLALVATIGRQVILGFIVGCVAWFIHNKWLKKLESTGDT